MDAIRSDAYIIRSYTTRPVTVRNARVRVLELHTVLLVIGAVGVAGDRVSFRVADHAVPLRHDLGAGAVVDVV